MFLEHLMNHGSDPQIWIFGDLDPMKNGCLAEKKIDLELILVDLEY